MANNIARSLGEKYINKTFAKQLFIILIFLTLFFLLIAFFYYNTTKKVETIWNENIGLFNDTEKVIKSPNVLTANSLKATYIVYMTIDNAHGNLIYNFNSSKSILRRKCGEFQINYKPKTNHLSIVFGMKQLAIKLDSVQSEDSLDLHKTEQALDIPGIPLQKWFQLAIIIDGRNVDIYIDKLLVRNYTLDNIPILSNDDIILGRKGHNPNIYIGKIEYSPTVITPNELRALHYKNMPGLFVSSDYRQQMIYEGVKFRETLYNRAPSPA
jgi:cbb3-type cytochrome oxidase subunit 3